jgi:hypothetical protein
MKVKREIKSMIANLQNALSLPPSSRELIEDLRGMHDA